MTGSTSVAETISERIAFIIADYADMKARRKGEWYLLEPGDPFYEDYKSFSTANPDCPQYTNFVQYFTQEGERVERNWADVKPKRLSDDRLQHFRKTPNELLIGRDGTLIVSAGMWGRKERQDGGYEYLPREVYWAWRGQQLLEASRTIDSRPAWAEDTSAIATWGCVEYSTTRGKFVFKQRLEKNGSSSAPHGFVGASFAGADDLREISRNALELAELLEQAAK